MWVSWAQAVSGKSATMGEDGETTMPKKKTPDENPKDQFKRFVEAAKEREVDKERAEHVFKKVARPKDDPKST